MSLALPEPPNPTLTPRSDGLSDGLPDGLCDGASGNGVTAIVPEADQDAQSDAQSAQDDQAGPGVQSVQGIQNVEDPCADTPADQTAWQVFGSTFVTIFLAEVGDKTQVTTLLMSAQSHKPWLVFAGAASALVATSLLGVLLGRWLAKRLSPRTLELGAGGTLLVIAALLIWNLIQEGG